MRVCVPWAHKWVESLLTQTRGCWVSGSITLHSIPSRQGLLLSLELGWQSASSSNPLISTTHSSGVSSLHVARAVFLHGCYMGFTWVSNSGLHACVVSSLAHWVISPGPWLVLLWIGLNRLVWRGFFVSCGGDGFQSILEAYSGIYWVNPMKSRHAGGTR